MNKSILQKFAIEARIELREKIKSKAFEYGIKEDGIKKGEIESSDYIVVNGKALNKDEKEQRRKLIKKIETLNEEGSNGFDLVIEEVAYTWFNRLMALRFMEVNRYIKTRVLSSEEDNKIPDIVTEALDISFKNVNLDEEYIRELKLSSDIDATQKLFKYMVISQCNELYNTLPFMFEKISDYTELLFPNGLLDEGSFVSKMIDKNYISEEDWGQVEIIGWLYQYYIAEEKDRVIKAKKKYKKEEIPFATQLFTPKWIVKYMVQNSLGRYWIESHPEDDELKKEWEFYLENPKKEEDFEEKIATYINKELKVEDIKCFDPACGSGHILVYMFEVLYEIYSRVGYEEREIPRLIIENNLYGLDIDDRAYQLACFAVVMKGASYNKRLLRSIEKDGIKLNIVSIQETNNLNDTDIAYIAGEKSGRNFDKTKKFVETFYNGKTYGSLIKIDEFDKLFFKNRLEYINNNPVENIAYNESVLKGVDNLLDKIINQAEIIVKTYDILVTNPPYMGSRYMESKLTQYLKKHYNNSADLFAAFMEYCFKKIHNKGHLGFLTPYVWMFLDTYKELRGYIVENKDISSLIQLEYNAFPEACVQVCTCTFRNYLTNISGEYIRLSDFTGSENQPIKTLEAIENSKVYYRYTRNNAFYENIPFNNIGYWISHKLISIFKEEKRLIDYIDATGSQNITANNNKYLRYLWEVNKEDIINRRWALYTKGGTYRKWYGNMEWVVDWCEESINYYKIHKTATLLNEKYWFRKGLSYNGISNRGFSIRVSDDCIYDKKGPTFHIINDQYFYYILGLLNTNVANYIMNLYNPTMSYQKKDVDNIPIIFSNDINIIDKVKNISYENFEISKDDWDEYEVSIDFKSNTLLRNKYSKIENAINLWKSESEKNVKRFKHNEEILNEIFIDIYDLNEELDKHVILKDITLKCNPSYRYRKNKKEDDNEPNEQILNVVEYENIEVLNDRLILDKVKEFISYAVGCMLGRYSLDNEGLIHAGGEFDFSKYTTFKVDDDNIIPMLDESYFEDDIVSRFIEFVKITFGEETLNENLDYIAETLEKRSGESSRDTIRRYFLNDFYKDHIQTYKKRPIYWLITSGKQKAFNALIYMHRYDKNTLSRIRTDYVHPLQHKLEVEKNRAEEDLSLATKASEKNPIKKKITNLDKQIDELKKFEEVLHDFADKQIEIDLDDGVVHNYAMFRGLLAKI